MSAQNKSEDLTVSMMHTSESGTDRFMSPNVNQSSIKRPQGQAHVSNQQNASSQSMDRLQQAAPDQPLEPSSTVNNAVQPQNMNKDTQVTEIKRTRKHKQIAPQIYVDHYDVVTAFNVTCPAQINIIEKLLNVEGLNDQQVRSLLTDLQDDVRRALELHDRRLQIKQTGNPV